MDRFGLRLRERLAEYREWIEKRDRRRFERVLLACLVVSVTIIISSAFIPGLQTVEEGGVARSGWQIYLGVFVITVLEAATLSLLLHRFNKAPGVDNNLLLALVILLVGATLVSRLLIIPPISAYIIPVAALGMVVTVILNARSALLLVSLTSLNIGLLTDLGMRYALVALVVGALSLYLVSRVATRQAILGAGAAAMGLAALTIFSVEMFGEASLGDALKASAWGLANGFLAGVLAMVVLQILETVFNLTTPLRLLELSNLAHPLLKKLMQVAPGTYRHSMNMGYLGEAAAEAIGADSLLTKVGAYYHDIGKTVRPEYFYENQTPLYSDNPHDYLSPSLSKLAITAHVRDGEDLGKVYGLPAPVVDIIRQHHGTSVLAYFYHKAQEGARDQVYEESYRYEEQKPRSKEATIIMLADSVEAAARADPGDNPAEDPRRPA
jgi:putative nucleotidyltransferase with HDIG domain